MTMLRYTAQQENHSQFCMDVLQGLSQSNKTLPCKYFYNARGSDLFEKICDLDEYYLTKTEMQLLKAQANNISNLLPSTCNIIEPGSGAGEKISILLSVLPKAKKFIALEISQSALADSVDRLQQHFPKLNIDAQQGDFTDKNSLDSIKKQHQDDENIVFFPGSTIGNFEPEQARDILINLSHLAGSTGKILIGVDLIKDERRLLAAYNDIKGVTAEFNKNILHRINEELEADIHVDECFEHTAIYNQKKQRIEMHLTCKKACDIKVANTTIHLNEGETIHTENSHKYDYASFSNLVSQAHLQIEHYWLDDNQDFALFLLQ